MGRRAPREAGRKTPAFGRLIQKLRKDESLRSLEARLRLVGVSVSYSKLSKAENHGNPPDSMLLHGLETLYGLHSGSLYRAVVHELTTFDATFEDIERIAHETPPRGGEVLATALKSEVPSDASVTARLLAGESLEQSDFLRAVQSVASSLAMAAFRLQGQVDRDTPRTTPKGKSSSRPRAGETDRARTRRLKSSTVR